MLSSLVLVPDLSPRLANGALASMIALKASLAAVMPVILAGSSFGPTTMKSLYITSKRSLAKPSATNLSSALRLWTSSTSASPLRADFDRLARTHGDHVDLAVRQLLEVGQDEVQEPRIGGAGGGGQDQPGRIVSFGRLGAWVGSGALVGRRGGGGTAVGSGALVGSAPRWAAPRWVPAPGPRGPE